MSKSLSISEKLSTKLFKDVVSLLKNNNIQYWLDFDTLLGAWSSKIGQDYSIDQNIYLSIHQSNLVKLKNSLRSIGPLYRVHSITNRSGRKWVDGETVMLNIINSWKRVSYSFKIIISIKFPHDNEYKWIDIRNCKHISNQFYNDLDMIEYGGNLYFIPCKTDEYLNLIYSDWKTIPKTWIYKIDDGTLASNSMIEKTPLQQLDNKDRNVRVKLNEGKNLKRMKEMLLFTIDILNENTIPFWIDAGTLLGIYREGDLIDWDYDADISIPAEYADQVASLWSKFLPRYIIRKKKINNSWLPGDTRVVKVKTTWEKAQQVNFHIDLFCVYKVEDKYKWIDSGVLKHVDAKYFDHKDTIKWEGREIPIPAYTEEYLRLRYGDWKTPTKNYNAALDDGAIAERGF